MKLPTTVKQKLPNKLRNFHVLWKLQKSHMNLRRHLMRIYSLKLMNLTNKLQIWTKRWGMTLEQQRKRYSLNFKNTTLIFNKIEQWMKRPKIQFKICRGYLKRIWPRSIILKNRLQSWQNKKKNRNKFALKLRIPLITMLKVQRI